jgi:hypothetical protein
LSTLSLLVVVEGLMIKLVVGVPEDFGQEQD